ncbi:Transcriptional activator hacA [Elsinoe australis]|uniref:Transcriptional activator hacA n=1 Tax=Elsinoe australis TaxID=40998 RepID=A0A2P8A5G6_9PEZI|nr:Transcriptional activator hacA [Elsinoe australis]
MDQSHSLNHGSDLDQHHQHSLLFDDTDANVFSLETGGAESRDMAADDGHFRRDSMNSAALSPLSEPKWNDAHSSQAVDINRRTSFASTNPFRDDYNSAYRNSITASAPSSSAANLHQPGTGWHFDHTPGTASPSSFEPYSLSSDDFDVSEYPAHIAGDVSGPIHPGHHVSAPMVFNPLNMDQGNVDAQSVQTPLSPHSNPDLMAIAAKDMQLRALPRHMRPGSASRPSRPGPSRAASDGVRKKNSRIEIPPDRTLLNIEELIEQAADDEEVKELKQQRRLLRNREAALASRQRKKQHTEDLEVKEHRYLKQINGLKNELAELSLQNSRVESDYRMLHQKHTEACHVIQAFEMEKEELIMKHTQETGNLRRKIQYLTEQLENPNEHDYMMSTNTNFNDFTSDMNALSVNNQPWMPNVPTNPGQYTSEPEQIRPAMAQPDVKPIKRESDPPIASGVLFMILLCGAFVASKGNNKPFIPNMPEEVRVASSTVLDNLLRDSRADALTGAMATHMQPHQPQMQNMPPPHNPWEQHGGPQDSRQTLYRSLTMPTSQQEAEQIFALTPSEYHSLTSQESYAAYHPQHTVTPRRNLAETLATVRQESIAKAPPAEVYTRSLLWDQIPADVVKQFKELVRESKTVQEPGNQGVQGRHDTKIENTDHTNWPFSMTTH